MARPVVVVDWAIVSSMCRAGCYGPAIMQRLGISESSLLKHCKIDNGMNFEEYRRMHLAIGNDTLRMKQYQMAIDGDKTMLVWLGKNRLGQRDKTDMTSDGKSIDNQPIINIVSNDAAAADVLKGLADGVQKTAAPAQDIDESYQDGNEDDGNEAAPNT